MIRKIIRYLSLIVICGIFSMFFRYIAIYIVKEREEIHRISYMKDMNYSGIIEYQIYNGEEQGYDYITYDTSFILAKYFFENNSLPNLQQGDSIYQIPGTLVLNIYRKDQNGEYEYIGKSQ